MCTIADVGSCVLIVTWSRNRIVYVPAGARNAERSQAFEVQLIAPVRSVNRDREDLVAFSTTTVSRAEERLASCDTSLSHDNRTLPVCPLPVVGFVNV